MTDASGRQLTYHELAADMPTAWPRADDYTAADLDAVDRAARRRLAGYLAFKR